MCCEGRVAATDGAEHWAAEGVCSRREEGSGRWRRPKNARDDSPLDWHDSLEKLLCSRFPTVFSGECQAGLGPPAG